MTAFFSVGSVQAEPFHHFLLPEIRQSSPGGGEPFRLYPLFQSPLLAPELFQKSAVEIEFFERNGGGISFGEIRPTNGYYYDSKSRNHQRLIVLLIGSLWQQETQLVLKSFQELWEIYSFEVLNRDRLREKAIAWMRRAHRTDLDYAEYSRIVQERENYEPSPAPRKKQKISGPMFYLGQSPMQLMSLLYDLIHKRDFQPTVSFLFIQTGGLAADAAEYQKKLKVPISFLHDEQIEVTLEHQKGLPPSMVLVNFEGEVVYRGEPLNPMALKTRIDRMLLPVWEQMGKDVRMANHQKRVDQVIERRALELARRQERARQSEKSSRGEALKRMQSSDPSVQSVDVKDLNLY